MRMRPMRDGLVALALAATAIGSYSLGVRAAADSAPALRWAPAPFPKATLDLMEQAEKAFGGTDAAPLEKYLAEDFSAYEIRNGQVKALSEGRAAVLARLGKSFQTIERRWLGSEIERIGHIGNTYVQVKYDRMQTPEGQVTLPSIVILQFQGERRWREWRIVPAAP